MSAPARLSTADLQALSQLLDEGLALAGAQQGPWLAALPPQQAHLRERLRALLATELSPQSPLAALPALDEDAGPAALAGETIGPYRLLRLLGRGGMGEVWLAERCDGAFERQVALKLQRRSASPEAAQDLAERLRREVQLVARLEHPHIARLYDTGSDASGRPFIAMEYVQGLPLDAVAPGLQPRARLQLFLQVLRAVAYAHARAVVHLDLKPAHVLVDRDGAPHLLDFGIAGLLGQPGTAAAATGTSPPAHTPRYAAPEQRAGQALTAQADVHALGVMLGELVAGPASSPDLQAIVAHASAAEPAQRYASVQAMAEDLDRHLRDEPVSVRRAGLAERLRRLLRRHRRAALLLGPLSVLLLALLLLQLRQWQQAREAADREQRVRAFVAELFKLGGSLPAGPASGASPVRWLDDSSRLIEQRFAGQYDLQAELYGLVAAGYAQMGAGSLAAQAQDRRVAALQAAGAAAPARAEALLDAAQAQLDRRQPQQAEALLARADAALALASPRRALLGARVALALGRPEQARRGLQLWEQQAAAPDAAQRAWAGALRAELLLLGGGPVAEALSALQQAAAEAPGLLAAELRLRGASWAVQGRRNAEAQALFDEARAALLAAGGLHRIRATVETVAFWNLLSGWSALQPLEPRLQQLDRLLAELRGQGDAVPSLLLAELESNAGSIHLNRGDLQRARPLIERGLALRLQALGTPLERVPLLGQAAGVAMDSGRHDLSDRLYRQRLQARIEAGHGRHFLVANDRRWVALNASMAGWTEAALQVLDEAPAEQELVQAAPEPGWYARTLQEARARVLLNAGRAEEVLALLTPRPPGRQDHSLFGAPTAPPWLRAEAQCLLRPERQALAAMRAYLQALPAEVHPQAPQLARLRAVAAGCAWRLGEQGEARALARLAGAALTSAAADEISPYYRAPWLALPPALR